MIYFDNASTTSPSDEVLKDYIFNCKNSYANPHSIHALGMENGAKILRCSKSILHTLGLNDKDYELFYTSGATESNNLAILGFAHKNKRYTHYMTSVVEHASVLEVFKQLEKEGYHVDYIKVNQDGVLDLDDLKAHLTNEPTFVSFMGENNEIGTVNDLAKIREILGSNVVFHSDLVQTIGKAKVDLNSLDMFSFTAHKIYGLKGLGCLVKKKKINIQSLFFGGDQQDGLRPGTMDFPMISSFCVAVTWIIKNFENDYKNVKGIRDYLASELAKINGVVVHDFPSSNPYILNISLLQKKASVVVEGLSNREIYVNSVSACYSKEEEPSFVLLALNKSDVEARNTIRLSFGRYNTMEEARQFLTAFLEVLESIRG